MRRRKTKYDYLRDVAYRCGYCQSNEETAQYLNSLWRIAFERGEQYMAKIMREGGHVVYDHPKETP